MSLLKVTVSGDFYSNKETVDFDNVVVIMPKCHEHFINPHIHNRLLVIALKEAKDGQGKPRFPQKFDLMRHCYVDNIEEIDGEPSVIGKDIKEMSWEDLQILACYKNLRKIPAYRSTDLRSAREIAYIEYSKHILGNDIDPQAEGYFFGELPELKVENNNKSAKNPTTKSNDEVLDDESADDTFTMEELKKMAKEKGIRLAANVSKKKAYEIVVLGIKKGQAVNG